MKKSRVLILITSIILVLLIFVLLFLYLLNNKKNNKYDFINDNMNYIENVLNKNENNNEIITTSNEIKYNKLMVVAHPDDDTIFGGAHLINDDYLVICVTCGSNKTRVKEFEKVMSETNDKYIMLNHSDVVNGYISKWENEYDLIEKELKEIIQSNDWKMIVTHNPEGEYGHSHHKKINTIVTKNVEDKEKLYYFGKYYKKDDITNDETLSDELYNEKLKILSLYKTQKLKKDSKHSYMFKHENWISYSDWS